MNLIKKTIIVVSNKSKNALDSFSKTKVAKVARHRLTPAMRLRKYSIDLKKLESAHDLLVDYHKGSEIDGVRFMSFGIINTKHVNMDKHGKSCNKLCEKLAQSKFSHDAIKDAVKMMKIRSYELKDKTHDEITKKIGLAFRSLHMKMKNKIAEISEKEERKLHKKQYKISLRKEKMKSVKRKIDVSPIHNLNYGAI